MALRKHRTHPGQASTGTPSPAPVPQAPAQQRAQEIWDPFAQGGHAPASPSPAATTTGGAPGPEANWPVIETPGSMGARGRAPGYQRRVATSARAAGITGDGSAPVGQPAAPSFGPSSAPAGTEGTWSPFTEPATGRGYDPNDTSHAALVYQYREAQRIARNLLVATSGLPAWPQDDAGRRALMRHARANSHPDGRGGDRDLWNEIEEALRITGLVSEGA